MSTYGSAYFNVLEKISSQFLGLHNLNSLTHFQQKVKCFNQYGSQPHQYYACFMQVEEKRESDSKELVSSYNLIEEEFKLCSEGCKAIGSEGANCINTCTERFSGSVQNLYESFYRNRVGNRKEYKKARA